MDLYPARKKDEFSSQSRVCVCPTHFAYCYCEKKKKVRFSMLRSGSHTLKHFKASSCMALLVSLLLSFGYLFSFYTSKQLNDS